MFDQHVRTGELLSYSSVPGWILGREQASHVWATLDSLAHPVRTQVRLGAVIDPVRKFLLHRLTSRQQYSREEISPYFRVKGRPR